MPTRRVTMITTGGTIEKTYDEHTGELVNRVSLVQRMLDELRLEDTEVEVVESTFNTEIAALTSNFKGLAGSLQEARLTKEEQASTIRVVESAIVPRVPVGPNRQKFILPAAVSGLVIAVFVALLVHYVQTGSLRAGGGTTPQTREPVS